MTIDAIVHAPLTFAPPDAAGRIQHIGRFPLQNLTPGHYVVRVTVSARGHEERRDADLQIID